MSHPLRAAAAAILAAVLLSVVHVEASSAAKGSCDRAQVTNTQQELAALERRSNVSRREYAEKRLAAAHAFEACYTRPVGHGDNSAPLTELFTAAVEAQIAADDWRGASDERNACLAYRYAIRLFDEVLRDAENGPTTYIETTLKSNARTAKARLISRNRRSCP